jgi:hypothetical protein
VQVARRFLAARSLVRKRASHYRNIWLNFLMNFCATFEKANKKANIFPGLGRTMPHAAKTKGLRQGENPARWRGHLDHLWRASQNSAGAITPQCPTRKWRGFYRLSFERATVWPRKPSNCAFSRQHDQAKSSECAGMKSIWKGSFGRFRLIG